MRMPLAVFLSLILLTSACFADDDDEPKDQSVLVVAKQPQRGEVPDTLTAYGNADINPKSIYNISLPHAGQVVTTHVSAGQAVHKGDPIVDLVVDPAAVAEWKKAQSELTLAKSEREHAAQLLAQHLGTRAQLDQAEKGLADAQNAVDALQREGGGNADPTVIAPFDGIVTSVAVGPGDRVAEKAPLATIASADATIVTVGIEADDRTRIAPGQPARLEPLDGGKPVEGKVSWVSSVVNQKSRMLDVVIAAPAGSIIAGQNFRAVITVGKFDGWVVPRDAVLSDDKGAYIFQVNGEKAVRVNVSIVGSAGGKTVVAGPIDEKRKLVMSGNYQLSDGVPVREDDETDKNETHS